MNKGMLIWVLVCAFLGTAFGYFFNTQGVRLIADIWLMVGCLAGWMLMGGTYSGVDDDLPLAVLGGGWLMFGISLGVTVALMNYKSWLSPLLR